MTVACGDVLTVGDHLAGMHAEEFLRSAISRHFYAAFHRAVIWQNALPGAASAAGYGGGVHQDAINRLKNPDRSCGEEQKRRSRILAAKVEVLRKRRVVADYQLGEDVVSGEALAQQELAKRVFADCDAA